MTSAIPHSAPIALSSPSASATVSGTSSPLLAGAVPAQLPPRSYATATKTATSAPPPPAGASAQNAKSSASPVNGATPTAHGGSQATTSTNGAPNGVPSHSDHSRKPSMVITPLGASGYTPNGGPVGNNSNRPPINFGMMNAGGSPLPQQSVPYQSQSSLPAPTRDPRVTSPAHSPSPIPQPAASGGKLPPSGSGLQNSSNGMIFGQLAGENEPMRQGQMSGGPLGPGIQPLHERRQSSQSMQSDMSNPNMPNMNRGFAPPAGRGRGFPQQQPYGAMPSPGPGYRQMPGQQRPGSNVPPHFQQTANSPYMRGRNSPALQPAQPHFPQQQHSQQYYGQHMPPQQQMYGHPQFDPYSGGYQPYGYGYQPQAHYPGQGPPASPRPYPTPFGNQTPGLPQPPFAPADMSRSASQSSRPPSSIGQPQTPSLPSHPPPSQTPVQNQQPAQPQQASAFVRPKKSVGVKITDPQGNELNFGKPPSTTPTSTQTQPQTPVIVSTPNAPTPPPRAPSAQHARADSKPAKSAEETKNAFQEQVKRQMEEEKRKNGDSESGKARVDQAEVDAAKAKESEDADDKAKAREQAANEIKEHEEADVKAKAREAADAQSKDREEADAKAKAREEADAKAKQREEPESAAADQLKQATAEAEKAAAVAAHDKEAKEAVQAAQSASTKSDSKETSKEETEDERLEREIAEMEAHEREDEEREKAYNEKRRKEKEAAAIAEAAKGDLKRQEREAEEREEARERERNAEKADADVTTDEPDEEAKSMFASLKKSTFGPGVSQPQSGAETPIVEEEPQDEAEDAAAIPPPSTQPASAVPKALGGQKQRPTQLKLEMNKRIEPAEPTPGMQALKSARFLELMEEAKYPDGFKSPNPALNIGGSRKGRAYDKEFLMQFQNVFKEKPSVDWDQKIKETLGPGDEPGSARLQSAARSATGMSARQPSGRSGGQTVQNFGGPMGSFGGPQGRTLPPNTTSQERFLASQPGGAPRPGMPMAPPLGRIPSQLGMGTPGVGMSRTNSLQQMSGIGGPGSPRQPSTRGGGANKGGSRRGDRTMSRKEEMDMANKMPLTAHKEIAPLKQSTTGWQPASIVGRPMDNGPGPDGHMAPDMVQRKVKAALNKMTPEKFDKISDQILEIAGQSRNESDGRTLRQVIQLTFEKACDEAHWAGMYAKFCHKMLTSMSPEIRDETIKDKNNQPVVGGALFRKYLLNRCQEEFERGWQVNLPDKPEGESQEAALLSDEYYIAAAAKRRGLGLIQFIGQLYKLRMLTLRIMHECVLRLLNFEGDPDEAAVENLTTLLRAVGATMEEDEQGRGMLNMYFQRIDDVLLKSDSLASRPRFMIMDLRDLRRAHWKGKGDDSKGPKTLEQVHLDAAAAQAKQDSERQRTSQRGGPSGGRMPQGRGDARNFSGSMQPPVDHSRTTVGRDDLLKLQNRGQAQRQTGGGLGPGGNLGPGSALGARASSKRGLGPPSSSGNTTRTNTPPVDNKDKKDEPSTQQNTFSALASLDPSGETADDNVSHADATSSPPQPTAPRTKSPLAAADKPDTA